MRWILSKQANHNNWQLEGAAHSMEIHFSKHAQSFRMNTGEKRLYFMERTGFFHSKLLITSEYHVKAAECHFFKNRFAGTLQTHNEKYEFRADGNQLSVWRKDKSLFGHTIIENLESIDIFEFAALAFSFTTIQQQQNPKNSLPPQVFRIALCMLSTHSASVIVIRDHNDHKSNPQDNKKKYSWIFWCVFIFHCLKTFQKYRQ